MKKVYLIGHYTGPSYQIDGIFDSENAAVKECLPNGFVMPIELNVKAPVESVEIGYYPNG